MRIIDLLDDRSILLDGKVESKKDALDRMSDRNCPYVYGSRST